MPVRSLRNKMVALEVREDELNAALAGILLLIAAAPTATLTGTDGSVSVLAPQVKVVAGRGFEPLTFRL